MTIIGLKSNLLICVCNAENIMYILIASFDLSIIHEIFEEEMLLTTKHNTNILKLSLK